MNRRGFTFIELVSVWAIIAVLAAILFPVFARAREKAYPTNCLSNLVNIGAALKIYAQDNYGHFPPENNNLWPLPPPKASGPTHSAIRCWSCRRAAKSSRWADNQACDGMQKQGDYAQKLSVLH